MAMRKIAGCSLVTVLLVAASFAQAQQSARIYRIGYLTMRSSESDKIRLASFLQRLQELGYIEGKNILIEVRRGPLGQPERLRQLATELVRMKMEVIVASSGDAARVAREATTTIPIVFTVSADPMGEGLVQNLAHPGGNVTGLSDLHGDMVGKRLELLKEIVPLASRIAFLWNSNGSGGRRQLKEVQTAAPAFGVTILSFPVTRPEDFDNAFTQMRQERVTALIVHGSPLLGFGSGIGDRVKKSRLPHIFTTSGNVEAGGLMSYGASHYDLWRRAATYVDKILKGTKPSDLPVEQPTKFELVINLKTAKQIGLIIPQSVLYRADKVIK